MSKMLSFGLSVMAEFQLHFNTKVALSSYISRSVVKTYASQGFGGHWQRVIGVQNLA
jgi:hypothetical protein